LDAAGARPLKSQQRILSRRIHRGQGREQHSRGPHMRQHGVRHKARMPVAFTLLAATGLLALTAGAAGADQTIDDAATLTIDGAVLIEPHVIEGALHVGTTPLGGTLDVINAGTVISDSGTVASEPGSVGTV